MLIPLMVATSLLTGCSLFTSTSVPLAKDPQTEQPVADRTADTETAPAWEVSPLFDLESPDLQAYQVRGLANKVAIRGDDTLSAGQHEKYLWFFWGDDVLDREMKVMAVRQGTTDPIELIPPTRLTSPLYGADATLPSTLTLPSAGLWRLDAYLGDELFGSIVVSVR
ncbi:MAG TPA: DUF4871 domain-containing protein [Bacilli bacterium]|nr:DUF4871 domain-containing protein [Bacilli bacterium]